MFDVIYVYLYNNICLYHAMHACIHTYNIYNYNNIIIIILFLYCMHACMRVQIRNTRTCDRSMDFGIPASTSQMIGVFIFGYLRPWSGHRSVLFLIGRAGTHIHRI